MRVQVVVCGAFAVPMFGQVAVTEPIPPVATINVDAGKTAGEPIPRTIFGTFLEPIGNSTYNGLWAELLENPSFESGLWSPEKTADMLRERPELRRSSSVAIPLPWEPLDARQGNRTKFTTAMRQTPGNRCGCLRCRVNPRGSNSVFIFPFIAHSITRAASTGGIWVAKRASLLPCECAIRMKCSPRSRST